MGHSECRQDMCRNDVPEKGACCNEDGTCDDGVFVDKCEQDGGTNLLRRSNVRHYLFDQRRVLSVRW